VLIYVSKVVRLPLVDVDGGPVGRLDDVVLAPPLGDEPPRVLGFVASVHRRRIFVNANRVGEVSAEGVRLHSGTVDLRHFQLRPGELLAAGQLLDRRLAGDVVSDLGLGPSPHRSRTWHVESVALRPAGGGPLRRRPARVVDWREAAALFDTGPMGRQVAELRDMHPSDVAEMVRRLPLDRRRQLADAMEDERLADLLEELPETEQLGIVEGLDLDRVAHVLEEMEPDDAVDLLAEMPGEQRRQLLEAMEPDEAADLRRLLRYGEHTAGGLMTPEPVILAPETTVAEALARLRDSDLAVPLATQVFVAQPPTTTPTGTFLGMVGFQRLLREPPGIEVGRCLDEPVAVPAEMAEGEVARRLAAYDLMALAVCDGEGRLLGAVTVDDVLDHALPAGWRQRR
jgi:CBS domain-containing protein